jgi:hypothetical protein
VRLDPQLRLRADALAGLTVGVITLPLSMALAVASDVPPQHGLYTAIVGGILIALTGGSRFNVSGPTAALVVTDFQRVRTLDLTPGDFHTMRQRARLLPFASTTALVECAREDELPQAAWRREAGHRVHGACYRGHVSGATLPAPPSCHPPTAHSESVGQSGGPADTSHDA